MSDTIEMFGRSMIQHGKFNDRVYLMKLHVGDAGEIIPHLEQLATSRNYSKIFAKVPQRELRQFIDAGYNLEAEVPGFFPEGEAVCFMGRYFSTSRGQEQKKLLVHEVLEAARTRQCLAPNLPLPEGFSSRIAHEEDVTGMAAVYRNVFATYPFPIDDPGFLRAAMYGTTIYSGVWKGEEIVALSSAETDPVTGTAEMTDFAVLPEYRGHGLALYLLQRMEETVKDRGIHSLYTIARAYSHGMNITFARNAYSFGGTLVNNTNISGNLESMNVWFKSSDNKQQSITPNPTQNSSRSGSRRFSSCSVEQNGPVS
jgi:beta-lysine N6-acetyltransferase